MVSKKELLQEINISYGQLYRWKREGLIPDDWFIKQAVSTGQETFFERKKIIPRLKKIIQLKDQFSLAELKAFLNPDLKERIFSVKEAILIDEIDPFILKLYLKEKSELTIYDLIIIYFFSTNQDILNYSDYQNESFEQIKSIGHIFIIIEVDADQYRLIIAQEDIYLDPKMKIIKKKRFEEISSMIATSLKEGY